MPGVLAPLASALPPRLTPSPSPSPSPSGSGLPITINTQQAVTSVSKLVVHGYHVALIVAIAIVLRLLAYRTIGRFTRSIASGRLHRGLSRLDTLTVGESTERREQRAATLASVLRSISNAVIFTIALILIVGELGLNLAPILASAGIVGVAVGFGAQSVVKDFLAGVFLVLEDQYGVGDVIDLQKDMGITGTVEAIGLRSTRVRDVRGNLWHVRNGNVNQVGNISQGWSRILLDVLFDLDVDVDAARTAMLDAVAAYAAEPEHADELLEDAAVWGVEDVGTTGVTLRLAIKTESGIKDDVARRVRERLLAEFAARGIELAGAGPPVQVTQVKGRGAGAPEPSGLAPGRAVTAASSSRASSESTPREASGAAASAAPASSEPPGGSA